MSDGDKVITSVISVPTASGERRMCIDVRKDGAHEEGCKNMKMDRLREGVDATEPDRPEGEVSTFFSESEDDD